MQPRFIVVEGTEGAGKSTNLRFICDRFEQQGVDFVLTREPGGTVLAEKIRELLLADGEEPVHPLTELLLIFAARAQHIQRVIQPALADNKWVVCDRFTDATYAYQGVARGLGVDRVEMLEEFVQGGLRPDNVIVLDVPAKVGIERAARRSELDRFERESIVFFEKVRSAYQQRAEQDPERYTVVDASQPLAAVQASLGKALDTIFHDARK